MADKAAVIAGLRESRNKLNHGGRHWIKSAFKRWVSKDHIPGTRVFSTRRKSEKFSEQAFCSVGVLRDTFPAGPERNAALIALAETIDKEGFESRKKSGYSPQQAAEYTIIRFNDNEKTTWADVRSAFTKAARRLSQRKGL